MKAFRGIKNIILDQLKQGVEPRVLSWTIAWGITLSLFPILGATTLLCFLVATIKRYNQPVIQAANYLSAPLQLLLIPVFMKAGEAVFHLPAFPFNPSTLFSEFTKDPVLFLEKGGWSALAGVFIWGLIAFPLAWILQTVFHPVLNRAMNLQKPKSPK
jgi:uncharacterized protein (DUF2062 family)